MIRNTLQRKVIREVIENTKNPLSIAEILERAAKKYPTLGIATVYRTVKSLLEAGEISAVDIPGEAPRYEQSGKLHHHHFHCTQCGRVFDIEGCPGGLNSMLPPGFTLESHEIILFGACSACSQKNA